MIQFISLFLQKRYKRYIKLGKFVVSKSLKCIEDVRQFLWKTFFNVYAILNFLIIAPNQNKQNKKLKKSNRIQSSAHLC